MQDKLRTLLSLLTITSLMLISVVTSAQDEDPIAAIDDISVAVGTCDDIGTLDVSVTVTTEPEPASLFITVDDEPSIDISDAVVGTTVYSINYDLTLEPVADETALSFTVALGTTESGDDLGAETITFICNTGDVVVAELSAEDDEVTTDEDVPVDIDVLANDTGVTDSTEITILEAPANGDATVNEDGTINYAPSENFNGDDSFVYQLCPADDDEDPVDEDDCVSATVSITILPVNDPPSCEDAYSSVAEVWSPNHKIVSGTVLGVTDADGDDITITIDGVDSDEADNGNGDGNTDEDSFSDGDKFSVRAERSGNGEGRTYTIAFTASDGELDCSGTVTVFVPHDQRNNNNANGNATGNASPPPHSNANGNATGNASPPPHSNANGNATGNASPPPHSNANGNASGGTNANNNGNGNGNNGNGNNGNGNNGQGNRNG